MFHAKSWASACKRSVTRCLLTMQAWRCPGCCCTRTTSLCMFRTSMAMRGPCWWEEEGFLAGSPLVCPSWHSLGLLSRGSAAFGRKPPCSTDQQCTLRNPARADSFSGLLVVKTGRCGIGSEVACRASWSIVSASPPCLLVSSAEPLHAGAAGQQWDSFHL